MTILPVEEVIVVHLFYLADSPADRARSLGEFVLAVIGFILVAVLVMLILGGLSGLFQSVVDKSEKLGCLLMASGPIVLIAAWIYQSTIIAGIGAALILWMLIWVFT